MGVAHASVPKSSYSASHDPRRFVAQIAGSVRHVRMATPVGSVDCDVTMMCSMSFPWAEHGAERKVVPYAVATDMDSPNPD
jgi:hypothetical protein